MKTQQFDLYAAQDELTSRGREFADHDEIMVWANALRDESWWRRWYRDVRVIDVEASIDDISKGTYLKDSKTALINIAPTGMNEQTVIHEIAHGLAMARFDVPGGHDPFFARVYLELTYLIRGTDVYIELLEAFNRHGVVIDDTDEKEEYLRNL